MYPQITPIQNRIEAIHKILTEAYKGGEPMSSATKGSERELFARAFLSQVFPPNFRFSSGDITDTYKNRSGQIDIIVEFLDSISFPMYPETPRLYLAEGVAAAIEIKSDLSKQWDQILLTAKKIKALNRKFVKQEILEEVELLQTFGEKDNNDGMLELARKKQNESSTIVGHSPEKIPVIVVGYRGWKDYQTLRKKFRLEQNIDAIFQIDIMSYCGKSNPGLVNGYASMIALLEYIQEELQKPHYSKRGLAWNYLAHQYQAD